MSWARNNKIGVIRREPILASADETEISRLSAELSKYIRDNWLYVPLTTNPLFFGVVSEKATTAMKSWRLR